MAAARELKTILKAYTQRIRSSDFTFPPLLEFAQKFAERYSHEKPAFRVFLENTPLALTAELESLARAEGCSLTYAGGRINTISYFEYYSDVIQKAFKEMEDDQERPFPTESSLRLVIPRDLIRPVDVKEEFVSLLHDREPDNPLIFRLNFPEGVDGFVVTSNLISRNLLEYTVYKIKGYLNTERNADYMRNKLRGVFRQRERALKDALKNVQTLSRQAIESIYKPTDFSFQFWTHLATSIIGEYRGKKDKLPKEHGYCQAAYLIGYYNIFYKGVCQRERDSKTALNNVFTQMKKAPYVFTFSEIREFKDIHGIPFSKKYSLQDLTHFLEDKTTNLTGEQSLPEIIRVKANDRKDYFISRDTYIPLLLKKIDEDGIHYWAVYIEEWTTKLNQYRQTSTMMSDTDFLDDITERVAKEDPLLSSMLRHEIIYLLKVESKLGYDMAPDVERLFHSSGKSLIPLNEVLKLYRKELLAAARKHLPFWKTNPLIKSLTLFLRGILGFGRKSKTTGKYQVSSSESERSTEKNYQDLPSASNSLVGDKILRSKGRSLSAAAGKKGSGGMSASQLTRYRNAISSLRQQFVDPGKGVEKTLDELAKRWNPLYDDQAKADLVEDVNSMVRDFIRKLKKGFLIKPPDVNRIRNMADHLAGNQAFEKIKRKDDFKKYIEIYMIKTLGTR
ncbi:MAG: hypothetical protein KAU17_11625 [Spirochaetales bacterium]|nr:hypothetical protein [Spirochaetales bacterium]